MNRKEGKQKRKGNGDGNKKYRKKKPIETR